MAIGGHYWPCGRATLTNDAGNAVHLHLANYQERYYGGAGMIRLYLFEPVRGMIDVATFSPWLREQHAARCSPLEAANVELTANADRFGVEIDFEEQFTGFAPPASSPQRPASEVAHHDTVASWRFDGGQSPNSGAVLRAKRGAPINSAGFTQGYTIETFLKLSEPFRGSHAWTGIFGWEGRAGDAGKDGGYSTDDAPGGLALSDERFLRYVALPAQPRRRAHLLKPRAAPRAVGARGRGQRRSAHHRVRGPVEGRAQRRRPVEGNHHARRAVRARGQAECGALRPGLPRLAG
nr:hypothetical protein [Actinopolyspora mzabensis]